MTSSYAYGVVSTYRMRSNYSRTKLSRMEDFTIFAVFIFADAQVPNIILHIYVSTINIIVSELVNAEIS